MEKRHATDRACSPALFCDSRRRFGAHAEPAHGRAEIRQVKPGQSVLELVPGSGYWTRVFSAIVGSKGHVYTVWPNEMGKFDTESLANWQKLVATPHYANVGILQQQAFVRKQQ